MTGFHSVFLAVLLSLPIPAPAQAPTPAPPATPPTSRGQSSSSTDNSDSKAKQRLIPSYLILGTVFDEKALCFPGVRIRIRQTGYKKILSETYTNSRGEFAVRMPPGFQYDVEMHMKKYQDHTEHVDGTEDVQKRLSVKLAPVNQAKTGEKP